MNQERPAGTIDGDEISTPENGTEFSISDEFARDWTLSYGVIAASDAHLLGFGGTDPDRSVDAISYVRIGGEIIDLTDGSSLTLEYPKIGTTTYVPRRAAGLGADFVTTGELCDAPESTTTDFYGQQGCEPAAPASFLLRGDGTWEQLPLPEELTDYKLTSTRYIETTNERAMTAFHLRASDDALDEEILLRLEDDEWHEIARLPPRSAQPCTTADHLYQLLRGADDGPNVFTIDRYDLTTGTAESLPVPDLNPDFHGVTVRLACNSTFPIVTTSTINGPQHVYRYTDDQWAPIDGILGGAEMTYIDDVISGTAGIIASVISTDIGPTPDDIRYVLIDNDAHVTNLPTDDLLHHTILWAGQTPHLTLVDNTTDDDGPDTSMVTIMEVS